VDGDRAHALEELAGELRARLVREVSELEPGEDPRERIADLVDREAGLLAEEDRAELTRRVSERSFGLGPLEPLLADPRVDEVMANGPDAVFVEREGRLEEAEARFSSEGELRHVIERILSPLGRRVDEAQPLVDARLPDGSRVNVIIPPLSLDGPVLTIRRFRRRGFSPAELVEHGTLPAELMAFLGACVAGCATVLISGGTGSGKTTLLGALSAYIPPDERIVTVEDAAELKLQQRHVVRLEARPANLEGRGEVTIRALVRNALRMRPDRIVVGEVRGAEALDMIGALTTGHDGSLTTVHAGSPEEALRRLETLALMADVGLPHHAVRELIAGALDVIVHVQRERSGARRVAAVSEVVRMAAGPATRELYVLRDGRPLRRAAPTAALEARARAGSG
jgi:pilus assembly protein CpaF